LERLLAVEEPVKKSRTHLPSAPTVASVTPAVQPTIDNLDSATPRGES
jgi:hypothetical protein